MNSVPVNEIPRGKPKSGRVWKEPKQRFSSVVKVKSLRTTYEEKMKKRAERKAIVALQRDIDNQRRERLQQRRQKMEEKRKRKEANQAKAEIVQSIKNTAKLKRMRKKQLKMIKKVPSKS